jgi:geranylgeranyl pyrophosphate synthase
MTAPRFDLEAYLARCTREVDEALARTLPTEGDDPMGRLARAMRYAVLGGGKRLRPALVIAACEAVGGQRPRALAGACAVELVHAYSLVHDDLPAMDDDTERRGRPTVHVAFDEPTAILAGDALQTLAFEALSTPSDVPAARQLRAVHELARLVGQAGLVGGQAIDIAWEGREVDTLATLESIHLGKTAALFRASAAVGGHLGDANPDAQATLERYGEELGLAFQHADDRLDAEHLHLRPVTDARLAELLASAAARAATFGAAGAPLGALVDKVRAYAG